MKLNRRIALWTSAIFVAALGGVIYSTEVPLEYFGKAPDLSIPPICQAQDVRSVLLKPRSDMGENTQVRLERVDAPRRDIPLEIAEESAVWRIASPDLGEADLLFVQRIVSSLCKIPTAELIQDRDRVELGLDNPGFELDLIGSTPVQISFGNALPERRVAVWIAGQGGIGAAYSIPDKFLQWLQVPVDRIRNRKLLRMPLEGIDLVVLKRANKEVFSLEREGANWKLEHDGKEFTATGAEAQKFINRLSTMQALEIRDQRAKEEDCQKQVKDFEILFEAADRSRETLRFSMPIGEGKAGVVRSLACSSAREGIFDVHPEIARYLEINPDKFTR
jgi:hypothetical protein